MNGEKSTNRFEPTEVVFPKEKLMKYGVSCIFTIEKDGKTFLVLTTSPSEDLTQKKHERSDSFFQKALTGWRKGPVPLVAGMLSFPGGRVEDGDENFYAAVIREIWEETGLAISQDNLRSVFSRTITEQSIKRSQTSPDREGTTEYDVSIFTHSLNDSELSQLRERMALEGRQVEVLLPEDALAQQDRLRPTAIEAIKSYCVDQRIRSGELVTDILM